MQRTIRISGDLYASLLYAFGQITQFLYLPARLFRSARQESWVAVILGGLFVFALSSLCTWIAVQANGQSLFLFARQSLGKWLGGAVGLLYSLFFAFVFSLVLRNVEDFVLIVLLPGTPGLIIISLMALVALYGIWQGLEPLARYAILALVISVVTLAGIPLLLAQEYSILKVDPFLYEGWLPVLQGILPHLPRYGDAIIVLTLVPFLAKGMQPYRWTLIGFGAATLVLVETMALQSLVFGPVLPARFLYPGFELWTMVSPTEAVERIQVVVVVVWLLVVFLKLGLCLYAAAESSAHALGLQSHRVPAIVIALLGVGATHLWSGVLQNVEYAGAPPVVITQGIVEGSILLMLLLAVWRARRRQGCSAHG